MSWFDTSGLTNLAKNALKEAQKTIDKALDISDEIEEEQKDESPSPGQAQEGSAQGTPQRDDFFASWGLTVSAESDSASTEAIVVTESPTKSANNQSMWGSFAGSFFEQPKTTPTAKPPKAQSMNVIADAQFGSHDDLFSKSQLVMSDSEGAEYKAGKKDEVVQDERRDSSKSNILSLMSSSRNSSDSVEVLSQSMKTTPDSEASVTSISQCSSDQKRNSESVEILPDSLISPSSIECLGFDSYTSEKTSSTSSLLSPGDFSDKKSTPIGDQTEKAETADSVSLVADDDEDTMSYNSISECTAPTVLDSDDKANLFPKFIKTEPRKGMERELMNLEQTIIPQKVFSENSSNDGSSDRTLNADNDSLILENTIEGDKKESDREDNLLEKLSDSSSFYNVNVSSEILCSESSFVEVEKQQCGSHSSESSQKDKDDSIKERTSPVSSESKSDLVKIGSDRTSGHTSGDEVETATSSDIEIIPSPNGDSFTRHSPAKYNFKNGKFDGTTSPNLVDLVLGKSLATKIRGHTRELSETSIQSNTSDESQNSENERLMRRLCEMTEILDARENRLMEVSRNNAELSEANAELKSQVESLSKHEMGDINIITEDYTQRMSALEKKFQQAIREKDSLRKQLDTLKSKNSSDLENSIKEKEDMITQLHEEGEKLARQQLQHSNIIKKLRTKEKDNEQVIKGLRDKIAEQTAELDRVKRSMAAKEELEVTQIEAVYRLTTANKKMETELMETKSALDDASNRLETTRTSLEAARTELSEVQQRSTELARLRGQRGALEEKARAAGAEAERLRAEIQQLRADMASESRRWVTREENLRRELTEAREACAALEQGGLGGLAPGGEAGGAAPALLDQLAHLQRAALERDRAHVRQLAELEKALYKVTEREKVSREEALSLRSRLTTAEELLRESQGRVQALTAHAEQAVDDCTLAQELLKTKSVELEKVKSEYEAQVTALKQQVRALELRLAEEGSALEAEKKRNAILQEQVTSRGDVSPPHSVASDTLSNSLWQSEDGNWSSNNYSVSCMQVDDALSLARRREGELRAAASALDRLRAERALLQGTLASAQGRLDELHGLQEQYDALLQMYGEKEEQLAELRLDLQDVTQLYKAQLDELVALKQRAKR